MPIEFLSSFRDSCWAHRQGLSRDIKGIVLAAGIAKRMFPLSLILPKPLMPIGGVPIITPWVKKLVSSGIDHISLNLHACPQHIKKYFADGSKFGARISYVEENALTGTLGAIQKLALGKTAKQVFPDEILPAIDKFSGSTLVILNGDTVTNFSKEMLAEMYALHKQAGSAFTMVLTPVPWERRKDFGTAILKNPVALSGPFSLSGEIVAFLEKDPASPSNLNNASIYMVEMELLEELEKFRTAADFHIPNPFYDTGIHALPAIFGTLPYAKLSKKFTVWGLQYDGMWFDVGQKLDYLNVHKALLDGKLDFALPYEQLPGPVYLGNNTHLDFSHVHLVPPVIIGHNCNIEDGATVGPYAVIGDGWLVESGARITNSVLWQDYSLSELDNQAAVRSRTDPTVRVIKKNVAVEGCILTGGVIDTGMSQQVAIVTENGRMEVYAIDYIPPGRRI